ncbi:hypothetical protein [Maribacter sp. 2307UL18-2]|uniref:hypothetical protein n=1 Tax=Maribacter sp. 2307UL18-2 TaxID=3386274 RepID=UPI0039BD69A2
MDATKNEKEKTSVHDIGKRNRKLFNNLSVMQDFRRFTNCHSGEDAGSKIWVKVVVVNIKRRLIDLSPLSNTESPPTVFFM